MTPLLFISLLPWILCLYYLGIIHASQSQLQTAQKVGIVIVNIDGCTLVANVSKARQWGDLTKAIRESK